ncbi:MAG TPA: NHLP leader peptide family RiPP precursor [Rubrobacter sp.]|nr:NHLP leader peptide family RiPP precursor [Rubrobacter sp.]
MSEGSGRQETERRLIQRSLEDDVFRQQLLTDPRAIIERELGTRLPEGVRVEAVEETQDTIYLVLPSASPPGEGAELSDRELEAVAGGGWSQDTVNDGTCAAGATCQPCFTWSACE